jgi:hypothetical protein
MLLKHVLSIPATENVAGRNSSHHIFMLQDTKETCTKLVIGCLSRFLVYECDSMKARKVSIQGGCKFQFINSRH